MSNRLKRKLGNLGVDLSGGKANESFCLIGTPLPPLEKSKDNGEFVPLWKQDVRDEKGRRRLHGAFTGGFSAGYFNTVGSKEGWTPTTFVSSRSDRAKQKAARPEDFMDEEDLADIKEGRTLLDTTEEMDLLVTTRTDKRGSPEEAEQDSVASALEAAMLPPPKDSVGARILKKMGWRVGQGVGPRVTWRQRKLQDLQASTGQNVTADDIPEDEEEASKHTYAPRDTPVLRVERKDNSYGLGYSPGMGLNESLGVNGSGSNSGPKLASGFGLGALNDAEDDDVDVYEGNIDQGRARLAYDALHREDDKITLGGRSVQARSKPETRAASSMQRFRNGTLVLAGFILSDQPVAEDRWYPLPDIPPGWKPNPNRVWESDKENVGNKTTSSEPLSHAKWKLGKSADERGALLGETPLPAAPRSVFEYISQKDRERLKTITSRITTTPEFGSTASDPNLTPAPTTVTVPFTEPHIAQAALRGFQPFVTDPAKQLRYNAYLQSQAFPDNEPAPLAPLPHQKIDEFNKELQSYAKAALLFKPMSGAMANRFTSAAIVEQSPKVHEGLHTPSATDLPHDDPPEREVEKKEESPKAQAARLGMYGPLTREVKPWQPARLLCKRFGVKDPDPDPETQAAPASTSAASSWDQSEPPTMAPEAGSSSSVNPDSSTGRRSGHRDLANIGLGEDEDQGRDTLTYVRPPMDIFKAIFASDDEDSGDEDQAKDEDDEKPASSAPLQAVAIPPSLPNSEATPLPVTVSSTPSSYQPVAAIPEQVDLQTFKPTFVPRSERERNLNKKKDKKDKKKKGGKAVLVSFELEEEGGGQPLSAHQEKKREQPKKKKPKNRRPEEEDDDAMWVEKPPPDVVKDLVLDPPPHLSSIAVIPDSVSDRESGPPKGRKRAVDFM